MDSSFIKREQKEYFLLFLHVFVNMVSSVTSSNRVFQRKKRLTNTNFILCYPKHSDTTLESCYHRFMGDNSELLRMIECKADVYS